MRRVKVLYASKDTDSIDLYVQDLSQRGYDVVPCTRGATVLRMVREHRFDIAIISIELIGLNGFEICRKVREIYDDSALPVVLRSDRDSVDRRLTAFEAGANSFAFEPIDFDRLDRVLQSLLKFRQRNEAQITVADALRMLDAACMDSGACSEEDRRWPTGYNYDRLIRYANMLCSNYLDVPKNKREELVNLFRLMMHLAERWGSIESAADHLQAIASGTRVEDVVKQLRFRSTSDEPLTSADSDDPVCTEALIILCGFAVHHVCMSEPAGEAFKRMRTASLRYNAELVSALESIVSKDEFLDSILTTDFS